MKVVQKLQSDDDATKFLLELGDGARVEAVFLVLDEAGKDSLCISSQVGCALQCAFCSTGALGFKRNMTPEEIVDEVRTVFSELGFSPRRRFDISFMGMGEPLQNLNAVLEAKAKLSGDSEHLQFHLSTVGLVPKIRELSRRAPDVALQVSLHAADDATRSRIMPINTQYPIAVLLDAAEDYGLVSPHPVTIQYCLLENVNDTAEDANRLTSLVKGRGFKVRVVNFNPHESLAYRPTSMNRLNDFVRRVSESIPQSAFGVQRGGGVGAGCGQLDADYRVGQFSSAPRRAGRNEGLERSAL